MEYSDRVKIKIFLTTAASNFAETGLYFLLHKSYKNLQECRNLRYQSSGKRTFLDLIYSKHAGGKKPLMIYIHGGGWVSGLRRIRRFYCRHWAERGFITANIGYDYGVDAKHPEHIRQIFKGIEYVLNRAEQFNIDTEKIVVAGESAGGYFASLVGAVASHKELYDLLKIDFAYQDSFQISACVFISGVFSPIRALETGFPNIDTFAQAFCRMSIHELRARNNDLLNASISSSFYADQHYPPAFIIGSNKDKLVTESECFRHELTQAGIENEYFLCEGINGVHAGGLACDRGKYGIESARRTQAFLTKILTRSDTILK